MHEYVLNRVVYYATDENVRETSPDGKAVVAQHKAGDFSWDGPAKQKGIRRAAREKKRNAQ